MQSLGERLAALRKEKGLSQAELAKLLNMGQSTIAMYERNRRTPDPATLNRLADFFDVSVDYLLGRTDKRKRLKEESRRQGEQPILAREEQLPYLVTDHRFTGLLKRVPALSEEEKALLAEGWEWALRVIENKKKRCSEPSRKEKNHPPQKEIP